jgi:uncharacterized phage-like protein YoqJ
MSKVVCFTGHRPDKLDNAYALNHPTAINIRKKLYEVSRDFYLEKDVREFIAGGALGVDTWAALAILDLKKEFSDIRLTIAVPFKGQETMWPYESQKLYWNILGRADRVKYVCDPGYAPWKMQKRNEWMVDESDFVTAIWNGNTGGTGNCVKYAKDQGKMIFQFDPKTLIVAP